VFYHPNEDNPDPREVYIYDGPLTRDMPIGPLFPPWHDTGRTRFIQVRAQCAGGKAKSASMWSLIQVRQKPHVLIQDEKYARRTQFFIPDDKPTPPPPSTNTPNKTSSTVRSWARLLLNKLLAPHPAVDPIPPPPG
jgi:hypothetical protein